MHPDFLTASRPAAPWSLFLDDERFPKGQPETGPWKIARAPDEAWALIQTHGLPRLISFDHDLGEGIPSGFDFAKALGEWLLDAADAQTLHPSHLPAWQVHSANPPGAENIEGYLSSLWAHFSRELPQGDRANRAAPKA